MALASYPRSGNTWLRGMVEQATGRSSGSIYHDETLRRGSEGIVIKTHRLDGHRYTRAIHLVRNPMDAIYSHFRWKREVAKVSVEWDEHVEHSIEEWREHSRYWSKYANPRLLVRFEDMKTDPERELRRVLDWLGYAPVDEEIRGAVEATRLQKMREAAPEEVADQFFRKGEIGQGREAFKEEREGRLDRELAPWLRRFGYGS